MKKLIAGPWAGEFGWELFAWQAYVRSLSKNFDKTVVISRKGCSAIYSDFCDEYIEYNPVGGLADSFFMHGFDMKREIASIISNNKIKLDENTTLFLPRRIGIPPHTHFSQVVSFGKYIVKPEYITYGNKIDKRYDYIFHIRNRDLRKQDNWHIENWERLRDMFPDKRIACIGTKGESGWIEGTADLRGLSLDALFDIMRSADFAFGPSSGPMHLASLCGLPHVVWSIPDNKKRYEVNWNPLSTKVLFDSKFNWHPSPEYVFDIFKKWSEND